MRLFMVLIMGFMAGNTALGADETESGRRYSLSGSISLDRTDEDYKIAGSTLTDETTDNTYEIMFGWNKKRFEYGPFLRMRIYKIGGDLSGADSKTQSTILGGFFDYNFIDNNGKEKVVPYVGAGIGFGTAKIDDGTDTYKGDGTHYHIHLGLKYFVVQDFGFKFQYEIGKSDVSVDSNANQFENYEVSSSVLSAGLIGYF